MRFAWKMIAVVSVLLALSLAVGGVVVVESAFRAEVDTAITESQEDMKLFGTTLQALCLMESGKDEAKAVVKRVLQRHSVFSSCDYWVYDDLGTPVFGVGASHPEELTERETGLIETQLRPRGARFEVCSTQRVTLLGQVFRVERSKDITELVQRAEDNLRNYRLVMLAILLIGILLTTVLTIWMTQPIRRISRGAKQLSDGRYDRRVAVRQDDELGELAKDFNRMADALEEKIRALEDAAQRQKDFTASFAHELKTPLTSVIGYADTLRSRVLPEKQQIEAANYIFSEGKRLEAMSFALLDLFSLEREAPQMKTVSTVQLVTELGKSVSHLLENSHMRFSADTEPASIHCEPELMKILLYNLIDNARKASRSGDVIELRGRKTKHTDDTSAYRFTVTDHGSGIPKEALDRLTEPFYMVDKSRARAQGGAGLGLALCQKIAEVHGGKLVFDSVPGRGTSVSLEIGGEVS